MLNWKHAMKLNWKNILKKYRSKAALWVNLATSHILPAAIRYQNLLANNIRGLKEAGLTRIGL